MDALTYEDEPELWLERASEYSESISSRATREIMQSLLVIIEEEQIENAILKSQMETYETAIYSRNEQIRQLKEKCRNAGYPTQSSLS